jgi:hypothetical protein
MNHLRVLTIAVLLFVAHNALATNSTTFWTPMTPDIQPYGVLHFGVDSYFRIAHDSNSTLPADFTVLTIGVLPFQKIQMEVGADHVANTAHPWLFNAKVGSPENAWFHGSPAIQAGIFNVTKKFRTGRADSNIFFGVIGKTFAPLGRFSVGPYWGNHATLLSSRGAAENSGFMAAFDRGFHSAKGHGGAEYKKLVVAADYASGKNIVGGGGAGLYYFFSEGISVLVGPVFFNDRGLNGKWKFTAQLDINLNVRKVFARKDR